jgi:catechol 2,3-dioxygenase-like lactoylglutathione lyase family enzyme/uncharacterized SAM-binding protein YcdF (DUF218 family)
MLTGLNHLTLAVRDLECSLRFYRQLLGFELHARWDAGAYLSVGGLWLCLSLDPHKSEGPAPGYTHYAFSIAQENFATFLQRLRDHGVIEWRQNRSEGDSLYFLDPDGHKLEAHVGDLASRLARCRAQPYAGMRFFDVQSIADYVMPSFPPRASDLGFLFGTRHGVPEFCEAAHRLWQDGMFSRLLVSGGRTGSSPLAEADMIAERLVGLGVPESALILETAATNTGENVRFGRARVAEVMDLAAVRSVVVIGKVCSTRRYLMTLQRHWPGLSLSVCPVNYFGIPAERWHEHEEFRARVLGEFEKIPRYLAEGFLAEIPV